ncbi:hypothetical protein ACERII_19090 [Evansella sp. AB-rgal1]|uniref:hypothetical protein n=1 Tax=Evansella sp. AB-rgal1 TaxID=3242696 RepID=UPI00359D45DF
MNVLDQILYIPSELLVFALLLLVGGIYSTRHRQTGLQVFYLSLFSLSIAYIITLYFPFIYTNDKLVPITHPNVQLVVTVFSFFIPLARTRFQLMMCFLPPVIFCLYLLSYSSTHILSIVGGILIGGFIIYTFYRTLDWIGGMPEPYLIISAILLPIFLAAIIFPNEQLLLYPGILLGTGLGAILEVIKVRMDERNTTFNKMVSYTIAAGGVVLFYGTEYFIGAWIPFTKISIGIILGLWITFVVPFLLVSFRIFRKQERSKLL